MRRLRIFLGIIILLVSLALLIWGFAPSRREIRTQPISPTDLQLPTPASFRIQPDLFV
jgi:hypothetical protein